MSPSRLVVRQFCLYLLSGGSATAINVGLFFLLVRAGVWYIGAQVISEAVGFVSAFLLHKYAVFQKKERFAGHFLRFCVLGLWNLFATTMVVYLCVEWMGLPKELAKLVSIACVVCWNFILYKFVVYV